MTWIKICGITNLEDAQMAVNAGADALGFVFYENSPRKIDPEAGRQIVTNLPANIEKVGVFAGDALDHWPDIAARCALTAAQLYPPSSAPAAAFRTASPSNRPKIYLAVPAAWLIDGQFQPNLHQPIDKLFVDSGTTRQPGGTGSAFDWAKAAPVIENLRASLNIVIAGGLNAGNVASAMRTLKPFGVDVASGVEAAPGKKDPDKVRAFIAAIRAEDRG